MIFDTDVIIWYSRGNARATAAVGEAPSIEISAATFMEVVQGARDGRELRTFKKWMSEWDVAVLALTEDVSSRAMVLMEEHCLSRRLGTVDALIAATAIARGATLLSANDKHYRDLPGLDLRVFRP